MKKRGQAWSVELIISLSVFVVIIIAVFVSMSASPENPVQELQAKSQQFISRFYSTESSAQETFSFIEDNSVNSDKLAQLSSLDYATLKSELGIAEDFCILLVDTDNKIIPIRGSDGLTYYYGIGSDDIQIGNNIVCNATVN